MATTNAVLVDSSVLLDIVSGDPAWAQWSSDMMAQAASTSFLVINPIIFAEISVRYSRIEMLDEAFPAGRFAREPIPYQAAFLAAKVHQIYRGRGGTRTSPLPDFFIGAHASVARYRLLTRDPARFRTYFPSLQLVAP